MSIVRRASRLSQKSELGFDTCESTASQCIVLIDSMRE